MTEKHAISVVVLAAGKGTRMKSNLAKVLHPVAGKPMLHHVLDTAKQVKAEHIHVVYGHGAETVLNASKSYQVQWHLQEEQLGTGHAVNQAIPVISDENVVLVLYGDVPLLKAETLETLLALVNSNQMAVLTVNLTDPTGYGRIIRNDSGQACAIVEHKEATKEQQKIREVNTGIMAVPAKNLKAWLNKLDNRNAQGEFYLTDIIAMAVADDFGIATHITDDELEVEGVNDRVQQAKLERHYQYLQATSLMKQGVTLLDPNRLDIRGSLTCGHDVVIDVNVIIEGEVTLGDGVYLGANTIVRDSKIAQNSRIEANCVIEKSVIGESATIGPFARLRPQTHLSKNVHVGNFVEIKKSFLAENTKAGHLSYLGDANIGKNVNIGAGTITCNYDGANKHLTTIEDGVFVGSDTQLIAPVTIGKNATIAAGTTVTSDVSENKLVISRVKQKQLSNWKKPTKKSL